MEKNPGFVGIFRGVDDKYYTADQWNHGQVPKSASAYLTDLVFDSRTKVIYYEIHNGKNIVFRHPYLTENGKYCRFVDGNFVEII